MTEEVIRNNGHAGFKDSLFKRRKKTIKNAGLYLFLIPSLLFLGIFKFTPMYFISIAFKDFNIFDGFANSPWVGLNNFYKMFTDQYFYITLRNTLLINLYKIVYIMPLPIIISILLVEIKRNYFRKIVQTVIYIPHFINYVIVYGIFYIFLRSDSIINLLLNYFGVESISFLVEPKYFRSILVISEAWKEVGWGTIIYLAAIMGIDVEMYEAAIVDGANKFKQIIYITIPCLVPTIILVLCIRIGYILYGSFDQIIVFYNSNVYEVADIIGTYVYRKGLGSMEYSYATAVGLFNSLVGFILVMLSNATSRKFLGKSIW